MATLEVKFGGTGLATIPSDGVILVGTGTGYALESGATARTSLGLGAADAVHFGSIVIGVGSNSVFFSAEEVKWTASLAFCGYANDADGADLGFYGQYLDTVDKFCGLFRDASDGEFKLFTGLTDAPTNSGPQWTVNTTHASFAYADMRLNNITVANQGVHILDTDASHSLIVACGENLSADVTLSLVLGASRTLTVSGDATVSQDYSTTGTPRFAGIGIGAAGAANKIVTGGSLSIEPPINQTVNVIVAGSGFFSVNTNALAVAGGVGRVGIGTTSFVDPITGSSKLRIVDGATEFSIREHSTGSGWIAVSNGTITGYAAHINANQGVVFGSFTAHNFTVRTGNAGFLSIDTSGNVGIASFGTGLIPALNHRLYVNGRVGIGTNVAPTGTTTATLTIANQAGAPTPPASSVCFYAIVVSTVTEAFVKDSGGTATQLSSHPLNAPKKWYEGLDYRPRIAYSIHENEGVAEWVNLTRLAELVEELTGKKGEVIHREKL